MAKITIESENGTQSTLELTDETLAHITNAANNAVGEITQERLGGVLRLVAQSLESVTTNFALRLNMARAEQQVKELVDTTREAARNALRIDGEPAFPATNPSPAPTESEGS